MRRGVKYEEEQLEKASLSRWSVLDLWFPAGVCWKITLVLQNRQHPPYGTVLDLLFGDAYHVVATCWFLSFALSLFLWLLV